MKPIENADVVECLALAHALLAARGGWCQGEMAKNVLGEEVLANHHDAARFCLLGSIDAASQVLCGRWNGQALYEASRDLLGAVVPGNEVVAYNDRPGRRKRDCLAAIELAAGRVGK